MICLNVEVNGEARLIAGSASAESVLANIGIYPDINESWLRVTGDVYPLDEPVADACWLVRPLKVGDTVTVQVLESDSPAAPVLSRTDPSAAATDALPLLCAFCSKSHEQCRKLMASSKAVICDECVRMLHQVLVDEGLDAQVPPA
jgi:ClpX C4-type zinc finger